MADHLTNLVALLKKDKASLSSRINRTAFRDLFLAIANDMLLQGIDCTPSTELTLKGTTLPEADSRHPHYMTVDSVIGHILKSAPEAERLDAIEKIAITLSSAMQSEIDTADSLGNSSVFFMALHASSMRRIFPTDQNIVFVLKENKHYEAELAASPLSGKFETAIFRLPTFAEYIKIGTGCGLDASAIENRFRTAEPDFPNGRNANGIIAASDLAPAGRLVDLSKN